ncbi:PIN domain-containing protein [Niveispirillum sp. KHB5.9]|uniref:PIN domain-containing protein n=1 Tax=Niveispirillum sp. KHB5.9 TaxID=3400269 RepID=UPI003A89B733
MRLVIDCNVIISAGLTNGPSRAAVTIALGEHDVLTSREIREEYRQVASRRKFSEPIRARLRSLVDGIAARTQDIDISALAVPSGCAIPRM